MNIQPIDKVFHINNTVHSASVVWKIYHALICLLSFPLVGGCNSGTANTEVETIRTFRQSEPVGIRSVGVHRQTFALRLLANGLIRVSSQSKLHFRNSGTLEKIYVTNGATVQAGQVLATLDNRDQQMALRQAQDQFNDARLELNNLVLQNNGNDNDTTSVRPRVLEFIKYKSGYNRAQTALYLVRQNLDYTVLRAPYAGVVANLTIKPYNLITPTEPFCTLLSQDGLLVEFSVLETELAAVQTGQTVQVSPVAMPERLYNGHVVEINPFVNTQGLVLIKARINRPDHRLFEGMNARVRVERRIPNQLVVPKDAVVERSGKKVVFTVENGQAKWNYVTIAYENESQVSISDGLNPNAKIIVSGNLNLGHDAAVKEQP